MGIKLSNSKIEARVLRALCSPKPEVSGLLLGELDRSYFNNSEALECFNHIQARLKARGSVPAFQLLCEDPGLSEEARDFIQLADIAVKTSEQASELMSQLASYRKVRSLWQIAKGISNILQTSDTVDADELLSKVADSVAKASLRKSDKDSLNRIGENSTVLDMVKDILYKDDESIMIPTGFDSFDREEGGFPVSGLTVLGGATGSGKSGLSWQMAMNQALRGYRVVFVPLEMSVLEVLGRTISNKASLNNSKVQQRKLATNERDFAFKKYRQFEKRVKEAGGELLVFKPKEDMTIQEILGAVAALRPHITYVDYISLLKGTDGMGKNEQQWLALGAVARYSKVYAESKNCAVVLLAQVNAEGLLRYSQAVGEHANTAWSFVATQDSKAKGYIRITPFKGRNQSQRPFILKVDYTTQLYSDPSPEDLDAFQKKAIKQGEFKESGSGTDNKNKYMPDLSGD